MKKIASIVMCLVLIFSCFGLIAFAETTGTGESSSITSSDTTVEVPEVSVSIAPEAQTLNYIGNKFVIKTNIDSNIESNQFSVSYISKNPAVATVTKIEKDEKVEWTVEAVGSGETEIVSTVSLEENGIEYKFNAVCRVKVIGAVVQKVEFTPATHIFKKLGETKQIDITKIIVTPSNVPAAEATFTSENKRVVTVDNTGLMTAVGAGETTVTIKCDTYVGNIFVSVNPVGVTRFEGKTRYETAIEISKATFADNSARNVVLAYGENYPDALAAAPLARTLGAPILLTNGKTITTEVRNEIKRLGADNIYIIGGENVISKKVEKDLDIEYRVSRIYGETRYHTSLKIANILFGKVERFDEIFLVSGENYPDALTISSIAAEKNCPILYVNRSGQISNEVLDFIESVGCPRVTLIGGNSVISSDVSVLLKCHAVSRVERLGGADRYETALLVANYYGYNTNNICVATGENYPDALTGSIYSCATQKPLFIVPKNIADNSKFNNYFTGKTISTITIFGGSNAVSDTVIDQIIY